MLRFFYRLLHKLKLLKFLNLSANLQVNDKNFSIPILHNTGYTHLFPTEEWMLTLLKLCIAEGKGTFIDIGANIGQTLLKLRSISEDMPYIGFEPNPHCVFYLNELIQGNKLRNCTIIPVGISDKNGISTLEHYLDSITDSSASLISDFRPDEEIYFRQQVPTFDISHIKNEIGLDNVNILKIDVEGGELEVIRSFQPIITKDKPIIFMEILPVYRPENRNRLRRQMEIEKILAAANYDMYNIILQDGDCLALKKLDHIGVHADIQKSDYLMLPASRVDMLKIIEKSNINIL